MYAINLNFDPTKVGFDPHEVTKNSDGTYTVTRRFVHAVHRYTNNVSGDSYEIEAYCPCFTDNVVIVAYEIVGYEGRNTVGVRYWTNDDNDGVDVERKSMNNSLTDYWHPVGSGLFNRKYDTHIEPGSANERACSFCVSKVNGHPNNITSSLQREYFEKYHIAFQQSPPTSPKDDPFLPEAFKKKMRG